MCVNCDVQSSKQSFMGLAWQPTHVRKLRLDDCPHGIRTKHWQPTHVRELRPDIVNVRKFLVHWQPTHVRELRRQKRTEIVIHLL